MIRIWTKWFEKNLCRFELMSSLYQAYYRKTVKSEIELARIKKEDRVLCIGGGAMPCTALALAKATGASIEVVDIDRDSVLRARKLVEREGLSHQIKIRREDGTKVDSSKYDVIHIALQVSPKELVLERIWETALNGSRIILRTPRKGLRLFYSNLSEALLGQYKDHLRNHSLKNGINTMDEILLMVKD